MRSDFPTLRDDEIEIIMNAPIMVAVLIAGADNNIDDDEIASAITFIKSMKDDNPEYLLEYYSYIGSKFEDLFKSYIKDLPPLLETQQHITVAYLRQCNTILPKMDRAVAIALRQFLKDLAKTVAQASGGVFGFNKISKEESVFIDLNMIDDPATFEDY